MLHRRLQTGSVSEADYEALVLKLHEIQVGGGGGGTAGANPCTPVPDLLIEISSLSGTSDQMHEKQ